MEGRLSRHVSGKRIMVVI